MVGVRGQIDHVHAQVWLPVWLPHMLYIGSPEQHLSRQVRAALHIQCLSRVTKLIWVASLGCRPMKTRIGFQQLLAVGAAVMYRLHVQWLAHHLC